MSHVSPAVPGMRAELQLHAQATDSRRLLPMFEPTKSLASLV